MAKKKTSDARAISAGELEKMGVIQEANRQFFHPLGLELSAAEGLSVATAGDAAGALMDDVDEGKARAVRVILDAKARERVRLFGWVVQPLPRTDAHARAGANKEAGD